MPKGTIRRLFADRQYGSIQTLEGKDLFFDAKELQGVNPESLREGQEVEFEIERGSEGRPRAVRVRPVQPKGE